MDESFPRNHQDTECMIMTQEAFTPVFVNLLARANGMENAERLVKQVRES